VGVALGFYKTRFNRNLQQKTAGFFVLKRFYQRGWPSGSQRQWTISTFLNQSGVHVVAVTTKTSIQKVLKMYIYHP